MNPARRIYVLERVRCPDCGIERGGLYEYKKEIYQFDNERDEWRGPFGGPVNRRCDACTVMRALERM
jgi:hypothetical protein